MKLLERWLEDPVRFAALKRLFYAALAIIAVLEAAAPQLLHLEHAHFHFEDMPGWGAVYGLLSTLAIILVSKFIGHAFLMRKEDYYE